ncbi:hypothetical protein N0V90_000046 [Kalmusia sp. IMI 367209]|nr:hypothetical protein N0V90_000046 [Kalmusia sp. IMI 367209]
MSSSGKQIAPSAPVVKTPLAHIFKKSKANGKADDKGIGMLGAISKTNSDNKSKAPTICTIPEQQLAEIHQWANTINPNDDDVCLKSRAHRLELLNSPHVPVCCGDNVVDTIPIRLILSMSAKLHKIFLETKVLPSLQIDNAELAQGLKILTGYLKHTVTKKTPYFLQRSSFRSDLDMIVVAEKLGVDYYIKNVCAHWWWVLKTISLAYELQYETLETIDRRLSDDTKEFPLIQILIDRITHEYEREEVDIDDPMNLWLPGFPKIQAAIAATRDRILKQTEARQAISEQRRMVRIEQRAKRERLAREEKVARKAVHKKLDSGSVNTVTWEEARMAKLSVGPCGMGV